MTPREKKPRRSGAKVVVSADRFSSACFFQASCSGPTNRMSKAMSCCDPVLKATTSRDSSSCRSKRTDCRCPDQSSTGCSVRYCSVCRTDFACCCSDQSKAGSVTVRSAQSCSGHWSRSGFDPLSLSWSLVSSSTPGPSPSRTSPARSPSAYQSSRLP